MITVARSAGEKSGIRHVETTCHLTTITGSGKGQCGWTDDAAVSPCSDPAFRTDSDVSAGTVGRRGEAGGVVPVVLCRA